MDINQSFQNNRCILSLNGRLDSNASPDLDRKIGEIIQDGCIHLVIDCKKLDYITSAGLRIMIKTAKALKGKSGSLVLCEMADYVREVFEIAGFDKFLPIVSTLDEALADASS